MKIKSLIIVLMLAFTSLASMAIKLVIVRARAMINDLIFMMFLLFYLIPNS